MVERGQLGRNQQALREPEVRPAGTSPGPVSGDVAPQSSSAGILPAVPRASRPRRGGRDGRHHSRYGGAAKTPTRSTPSAIIDKILQRSLAATNAEFDMKCLYLMAGGFVAAGGRFQPSCFCPVPHRNRRTRLFLHHFDHATLDRHRRRPANGRRFTDPLQPRRDLRSGRSERWPRYRPARGFCSSRSLDRQAAVARGAGPGRER